MTPRQLEILQHSLGVDQYGQTPKGYMPYTRNYFSAGARDEPTCRELVAMGYMEHHVGATRIALVSDCLADLESGAQNIGSCSGRSNSDGGTNDIYSGFNCSVTKAGKKAMCEESPQPPKLSRSQRRYRAWLDADCGMKFGEWIRYKEV